MRPITVLLSIFIFIMGLNESLAQKAGRSVPSQIEHATVYLSGAQISRSAEVQLNPGINTIIFDGLSTQLQPQSIQLRTYRPITLLSIGKNVNRDEINSQLLDSLMNRQKELQHRVDMAEAEQKVLQHEVDILMANKELRGSNEKLSAVEIRQAMDYFREKLKEIETARITLKNELQEAQNELREVQNNINEVRNNARKRSGQIVAEIQSPSSQSLSMDLFYFITGAGWYPSYDVRVEDIDRPLGLTYKANIFQNSGIDWNNVRLSISSAQPLASSALPVITPDYLSFLDQAAREQYENARKSAAQLQQLDEVAVTGQPSAPNTTVQQNQTSFTFDIEVPYSVPGDGSSMAVGVQNHILPASYRYFAVPKVRKEAYLTAHLQDWEELNLLNGEINLYFGNTYVGKSQLQTQTAGDSLEFSMGKDPSVVVERNRLQEFTEKNFFGNRVRETKAWELVVKNTKQKPIEITLVDQIPVSTHEDIQVELQQSSGASLEKSTGKLTWRFSVEPAGTQKREFRYQIEYPSGRDITR